MPQPPVSSLLGPEAWHPHVGAEARTEARSHHVLLPGGRDGNGRRIHLHSEWAVASQQDTRRIIINNNNI